ncbi:MAG: tail fiber domain-containing protein [Longimicrobiaceae bacterium]
MPNHLRTLAAAALAGLALATGPAPAAAQSDILLQLRSGSPPGDRFRVDSAGGFVALGQIGIGIIPASGAGWRLMWYPFKVAFRAGYADAGNQFDDSKIGFYSWAGGALSSAAGNYAFAMGNQNLAEAQCAVAIGSGNNVFGNATDGFATCGVALGLNNDVKDQAGVALGQNNWSDGDAAVAIGYHSTADADYSQAFGYRASTNGHTGAKVFGDASTTDSIEAVANNEFAVRAAGGFRFRTNATLTTGCNLPAGSGVFSCSSSRFLKEHFGVVDGDEVLARIRQVPVTSWSYIGERGAVRHLGPFAEDFHAAFGLGVDAQSIGLLDIDGVNFAGVKALEQRTTEQAERIRTLEAQVAELRRMVEALTARAQPQP